jgi:pimeloyl-ACP methyl ester carboxylesterase
MKKISTFPFVLALALLVASCGPPYEDDPGKVFGDQIPVSKSYQVMGRSIHFVETGQNADTLIIFIHGTPGSWQGFAEYLADPELSSMARMIAVDRPGFGKSDPGEVIPSLSLQASILQPLLENHNYECGAILVGHSLGAPLAARMAMAFPDDVGALVLIAPSLDPALEEPRWYNLVAEYLAIRWLIPDELLLANDEIMALQNELKEMLPLWGTLDIPVTLIQGDNDKLVDPRNAEFATRVILTDLKTIRLADTGHFVLWNRVELIKSELLALIKRHSCTTRS